MTKLFYWKLVTYMYCLSVLLQGCVTLPHYVEKENLDETILNIKSGTLIGHSRQELVKQYGPPIAIARQDGPPLYVPRPFQNGSDSLMPERFFEKFASKHNIDEHLTIYYYQKSIGHGEVLEVGVFSPGASTSSSFITEKTASTYKLWVLIDDRTNKIVDYSLEETEWEF